MNIIKNLFSGAAGKAASTPSAPKPVGAWGMCQTERVEECA